MTINFYDGSAGLFDVLGKVFHAMQVIADASGTTVRDEIQDIVTQHENVADDLDLNAIIAGVSSIADDHDSSAGTSMASLQQVARDYLVEVVHDDNPLSSKTYTTALSELRTQMLANSESFDASAVTATVATVGSMAGNGVLVATVTRGDGLLQQTAYAETCTVELTIDGSVGFTVTGEATTVSELDLSWPAGSGVTNTLTAIAPAGSLITAGNFDTLSSLDSNVPAGWIASVAQPGTTVKMTTPEQQTVAITGDPSGGYSLLHYVDAAGKTQTTEQIAYNATAATVQSRLRVLAGLASVTVTETGTSPNVTHTVTFLGTGGDVAMLTSSNHLTGGVSPTLTHAESVAGTPQVYAGSYALLFDSDGSELTQLDHAVAVDSETAYALNVFLTVAATAVSGVLQFSLVDGISGTVINDSQGNANTISVNVSDLTTAWQSLDAAQAAEPIFRLPAVVPDLVYLRMRISTAPPSGTKIYFDHLAMVAMAELYNGGPLAAIFTGSDAYRVGDEYSLTVTNDRAGLLHEWLARTFDLAGNQMLLPVDSTGGETIPDSVVS